MQKKKDHVHKYVRVYLGGRKIVRDQEGKRSLVNNQNYEVFKCAVPGCGSYKERELVVGAISRCWICDEQLVLDKENTRLKKPTHIYCRKIKEMTA